MRRRGRNVELYPDKSEPVAAREVIERRWRGRLDRQPHLATLVTAQGAQREPFHRWLRYKQGFSPGLARLFLQENAAVLEYARRGPPAMTGIRFLRNGNIRVTTCTDKPILDPFSGSGTCVVECARRGIPAMGIEALPSLVFLNSIKAEQCFPTLPDLGRASNWEQIADQLILPIHRAALLLAMGRTHTTAGRSNRGAKPVANALNDVVTMMREDLLQPLSTINPMMRGDARKLDGFADESVVGVLTSPPYLSRHDYLQITNPFETVYRYWYGGEDGRNSRTGQVEASPRSTGARPKESLPSTTISPVAAAVIETGHHLENIGVSKLSAMVRHYFEDMREVMAECHRVLCAGAPCWMVVGGARLKSVYVPADLMLAELAEECGFRVDEVRVARDLIDARRKFGSIGHLAPRESLLVMRKR